MKIIRLQSLLSVLLAALLLSGCGKPSKDEYLPELQAVGQDVASALDALPKSSQKNLEPAEVRTLANNLVVAADDLEKSTPPDEVAEAHTQFISGLRGVSEAFLELANKLEQVDDDEARAELFVEFASNPRNEQAFSDLAQAQESFVQTGYRVFEAPR